MHIVRGNKVQIGGTDWPMKLPSKNSFPATASPSLGAEWRGCGSQVDILPQHFVYFSLLHYFLCYNDACQPHFRKMILYNNNN